MYEFKGNPNNLMSHMINGEDNPQHIQHIYDFNQLAHEIAEEEIQRIVPALCEQICRRAFNETLNAVVRAIDYDITSVLTISFNDLEGMFKSEKARRFVSDAIIREIKKSLNKIDLTIKF